MQGIYTYIPETNYVPREYSVAAILLLLFMVLISLVSVLNLFYFYISTFRSRLRVQCPIWLFSVLLLLLLLLLSSSSSTTTYTDKLRLLEIILRLTDPLKMLTN